MNSEKELEKHPGKSSKKILKNTVKFLQEGWKQQLAGGK
jgi:hypothetical protein